MFETDEEQEMLYTLSVNLEYFEKEMKRASAFYQYGKRADDYSGIAKMLRYTCSLVRKRLDEMKE